MIIGRLIQWGINLRGETIELKVSLKKSLIEWWVILHGDLISRWPQLIILHGTSQIIVLLFFIFEVLLSKGRLIVEMTSGSFIFRFDGCTMMILKQMSEISGVSPILNIGVSGTRWWKSVGSN